MRISDWSSDVCSSDLLDAGVAGDEELAAQLLVDLFGDVQAAAELHPGVLFLGVEAKGHGGEVLGGRDLAYPVVRGAVAHLDGAVGDGIHGLEGRDDLAAAIDLDRQLSARGCADVVGELVRAGAQTGEVLRPGRLHAPFSSEERRVGKGGESK